MDVLLRIEKGGGGYATPRVCETHGDQWIHDHVMGITQCVAFHESIHAICYAARMRIRIGKHPGLAGEGHHSVNNGKQYNGGVVEEEQ